MSCLSRAPQPVIPRNNREEQVNRRVIRTSNQTFRVYIYIFFLFFKMIYLWENTWSFVSYVFSVWRIYCEVQIIYSQALLFKNIIESFKIILMLYYQNIKR